MTIEYGEYSGCSAKIAAVNKDGTYKVLPYRSGSEPGNMLDLTEVSLKLLPSAELSPQELRALVRAETTYRDYALKVFPIFNMKAREPYRLLPEDLAAALQNINNRPDPLSGFKEWFWLILNIFYQDLQMEGRYQEDYFSDAPETEDQLFSTVFSLTERLYWKLEERFVNREDSEKYIVRFDREPSWNEGVFTGTVLEEAAYRAACEDIISRVRTFEYNKDRPEQERIYSASQKRHIMNSFESGDGLRSLSKQDRLLYKKCVADLYRLGDVQAIKSLAWGYFEGESVYRQSFRQAEKYLTDLYRKSGDPYAAAALGYILSRGLGSKKEPDYEKAFQYYSYGALAGLDEAICHAGMMLIKGLGTVKNIDMGLNLIVDGYKDAMYRFSDGEYENKFAEYALRMGDICSENLILGMGERDAYKFYLEAEFAVGKRMESGTYFGDRELLDNAREGLRRIRKRYHPDPDRRILKADFPIYISHIFDDRFPVKVTISRKKGDYYLAMSRFRLIPGEESAILVSFPELSYVNLISELKFRLENTGVIKTPERGETFLADGFTKNEHTNALEFYSGGECVAAIEAEWFVIDITLYESGH